jgi:hypothetical protein
VAREPGGDAPAVVPGDGTARPAAHGWAGWVVFAGVLLILLGVAHVLDGLAALVDNEGGPALVPSSVRGWTSVVLGLTGGLVGLGLLAGALVARLLAVLLVLISAVVNLASVGSSPGAALLVAVDVVIVYAITVHGGELRARSYG